MRKLLLLLVVMPLMALSQNTITGGNSVTPGSTVTYTVTWSQVLPSIVNWTATGGTIISSNQFSCTVQWYNYIVGSGSLHAVEMMSNEFADLSVFIGNVIVPASQFVFYGTAPQQLAYMYDPGSSPSFQWQVSSDNITWTDITGAVSSTYQPGNIFSRTYYRCVINGHAHADAVVDIALLQPGEIFLNGPCAYNASPSVGTVQAIGGYCSSYTYDWEISIEGAAWQWLGSGEAFPTAQLQHLTSNIKLRRRVICGIEVMYSNILVVSPGYTSPSNENLNYVRVNEILRPGINSWYEADQLDIGVNGKLQATTYLDGLGRTVQTNNKQATKVGNDWKDMVQPHEYAADATKGDIAKAYLPFVSQVGNGLFTSNAFSEQLNFNAGFFNEPTNAPFYGQAYADFDPIAGRYIKQMAPGQSYGGNSKGSTIVDDYNLDVEQVHIWTLDYSNNPIPQTSPTAYYPTGKLLKHVTKDANGKQTIAYSDFDGKLILTKVQLNDGTALSQEHSGWICTYNVYDDLGFLRYTIQPEAVNYLDSHGWTFQTTDGAKVLDQLCFSHGYDYKGRNIMKKAPGAKELYMVYDSKDRLALTQDGNQRAKPTPEWTATIYDEQDRPVFTALYRTNKSLVVLQDDVGRAVSTGNVTINIAGQPVVDLVLDHHVPTTNYYTAQNSIEFVAGAGGNFETSLGDEFVAEINPNAAPPDYQTTVTVHRNYITPQELNDPNTTTVLKYFFYDGYGYNNAKAFSTNFDNANAYPFNTTNILPVTHLGRIRNMSTGTAVRILGTNTFLTTTVHYNEEGRPIQTIADNVKSGVDINTVQYHYDGRVMSSSSKHSTSLTGYNSYGILTKNIHDRNGRLTSIEKTYGAAATKTIASYEYDELGRPKKKTLAPGYQNATTGKPELESLTYSYDISNHITGINKDYALKTPLSYNKWGNYFGFCLGFDKSEGVFAQTNLIGKVSGMIWNTMGDDAQRKYDYEYDHAGRLIKASYAEQLQPGNGWDNTKMDFSVGGRNTGKIQYDLNGNLLFMIHRGIVPGMNTPINIDDFEYNYQPYQSSQPFSSNRLMSVSDANPNGSNGKLGDFKDGTNGNGDDYVYDDNGNLVMDLNKNVKDLAANVTAGIRYNFLDKPEEIHIAGKGTIKIVYDADGTKLQRSFTPHNSTITKTTYYVNGFVYEGNNLQYIAFEEGRIRAIQGVSQYNGYDYLLIDGSMDLPGGKRGVFDYFIKDHLGNVRMVLTEENHVGTIKCTMETNRAGNEEPVFGQVDGTGIVNCPSPSTCYNEVVKTRFDASSSHWPSNTTGYVSKVGSLANSKIGPNTLMKVMSGDVINANVQYYYQNPVTNSGNGTNLLTSLLYSLTQTISNSSAANIVHGQAANIGSQLNGNTALPGQIAPDQGTTDNKAKAYLSVLFFDERFNFVAENSTTVRVGNAGESLLALPLNALKAPKNGYAYVYVSNESDEPVYFDNLQVGHEHGRIIEENHFYAYGLKIAAISSRKMPDAHEGDIENKYLYNGKELWEDGDLDWYDYGFRNYDPQIGRFTQLDPLTFEYTYLTNYQYASCDPIANIDLDGLEGASVLGSPDPESVPKDNRVTVYSTIRKDASPRIPNLNPVRGIGQTFFITVYNYSNGQMANGKPVTYQSTTFDGNYTRMNGEIWTYTGGGQLQVNMSIEPVDQGEITHWEKSWTERWSQSESFLGSLTYKIVDDGWLFLQTFRDMDYRTHVGGFHATRQEAQKGFAGGLMMVMPIGGEAGLIEKSLTSFSTKAGEEIGIAAAKGGTTVLGHYPEYVKLAESIGARRFQIPTSVWNKMSAAEQWTANTKFLDRMILRGDNIRLATPLNQVKPGSFFQKELNYLFDKGYKVSSDGLWLVK